MTFIRESLKNSLIKGADRFKLKSLLFSEACFATFKIDSKDTVKKKPCEKIGMTVIRSLHLKNKQTKQNNAYSF